MSAGEELRLACIDSDAPPLFTAIAGAGGRRGFEPALAELIGARVERSVRWVPVPWAEMIPAVNSARADAILCGQGITAQRCEAVDFTRPYAVFHESVLVRRGSGIHDAGGLVGQRVAAIDASTNLALAQTFTGATLVPFGADGSDDVYADMLAALRAGDVDAVVDDDVVFVPLGESDPDFELAFTVRTGHRWGIAVAKHHSDLRATLDEALAALIADGSHRALWREWLPGLDYPFAADG